MLNKGESILLRIEKISSDGSGIARTPEGFIVFVPGALPGEKLRAKVSVRKKEYAIATPQELIDHHPLRQEPFCSVFPLCGGCQLQHAAYELQLEMKRSIVQDAFERIYKYPFPPISMCSPSPDRTGYRNKASLPVRSLNGRPVMGYFARRSHDIVQINSCPVAASQIDSAFSTLARVLPSLGIPPYSERNQRGVLRHVVLRQGIETDETLVSLVLARSLSSDQKKSVEANLLPVLRASVRNLRSLTLNYNPAAGNTIVGSKTDIVFGDGLLREYLPPFRFEYDTTAFFQINTHQASDLYGYTTELAAPGGNEKILELFSGIGTLTSFLAARASHVTAVEEWESAVRMMRINILDNGLSEKTTVLSGPVEDIVPSLKEEFDTVVLDPPRTGCDASVLRRLLALNPERIVYVSCNPATLARDAAVFFEGGFTVGSLACFDMFPQTVHVETAALFLRR